MSNLRDWAGLPDGLLHSIVELLRSFPDLLAFAATCHLWRFAFSSYPSKSTLYTCLPPLHLNPEVPFCSPCPSLNVARNTSVPKRPCYVIDLASQDTLLCCQIPLLSVDYKKKIPPSALKNFAFRGASFGNMIFCSNKTCFLFDVFTGIEVSPPPLPFGSTNFDYGAALTGPLPSPNSHLIVYTDYSIFSWRVGSDSWSKSSRRNGPLTNFAVLKGQVFVMSYYPRRLFMVHLTPQIHLQKTPISWGGRNCLTKWHLSYTWLVVCGDMLLLAGCHNDFRRTGPAFEAYHLDTSNECAKWVKVERLEKWAIFISSDMKVEPLSCMNPERWGGRSNCVYCYDSDSGHLVAFELGEPQLFRDGDTKSEVAYFLCSLCNGHEVQPTWVVPSMFSQRRDGQ